MLYHSICSYDRKLEDIYNKNIAPIVLCPLANYLSFLQF